MLAKTIFLLFNAFLASFDNNGNFRWAHTGLSNLTARGRSVATDINGNVYWAGEFTLTMVIADTTMVSTGGYDVFYSKFDK